MGLVVKNTNFSLRFSLTILRITGFWPPDGFRGTKLRLYNLYGFFNFMYLSATVALTQVIDLYFVWGNIPLMTGSAFVLFTNFSHIVKYINIAVRKSTILKIITNNEDVLKTEKSVEGRSIIANCNKETRRQLLLYIFLTYLTCLGWAGSAGKNELPIRAWYPYDISNTPIYEITYFHQLFTLFIAALLHMTKDSLLTTVIAQCRCRLQLVSLALRNLCNDRHFTECDDLTVISLLPSEETLVLTPVEETIVQNRLKRCVIEHQKALETVSLLQNTFSEPIFVQFNVSLVIICVTAFQMVSVTNNYVRLISMGTYLMNMMYQVFVFCYQGDKLTSESEDLAKAAYEMPWYACSVRLRRSILIVMVRCRRIAKITAAGFSSLSLSTFMAIIKTSYSMFTLLKQVTE